MLFNFQPYNFISNLSVMGVGMIGIFMIIAIIIAATYAIRYTTSGMGKKDD